MQGSDGTSPSALRRPDRRFRDATPMRPLFASLVLVLSIPMSATAQETIFATTDAGAAPVSDAGAGCGCRDVQRPPWHGNVQGQACGPACNAGCGGVFHANPCGQLHLRRTARQHCMTLPSCFPRLHGWVAEGQMPSPEPPAMPRCRQCGAAIEGGF